MWFSEKLAVCVDTRSASAAIYKSMPSGPRLIRFAFEHFGSRARDKAPFSDVLGDSRDAIARLAVDLKAPAKDASILLPIGAAFPAMIDLKGVPPTQATEISETEIVRFRLAPLLPFPVGDAEVRSERMDSGRAGVVLAQAILRKTITESEKVMATLGFPDVHVASALSGALRGFRPEAGAVDLAFGDSACAIAVRNASGAIESVHLRLLVEGDDRIQRSIDEALRAAPAPRVIRALGEDTRAMGKVRDIPVQPAFDQAPLVAGADPQRFPFLALFAPRGKK